MQLLFYYCFEVGSIATKCFSKSVGIAFHINQITGAIENVTSLESYAMSERAEKEITPLAQMAVVAEDKAMYDTQKSVRETSGIPVEAEMEEVGKSR